jgi:hypothetical protein
MGDPADGGTRLNLKTRRNNGNGKDVDSQYPSTVRNGNFLALG